MTHPHRKRIVHSTINTGGRQIPGLPFQGETMMCALCGDVKQSHPGIESQWERLQYGTFARYYCPKHEIKEKVAHFTDLLVKERGAKK